MKKIAILGATGYIGKSFLPEFFSYEQSFQLFLFSRSKNKISEFISQHCTEAKNFSTHTYDKFLTLSYDVIINCTGISDTAKQKESLNQIFAVTEEMDNLILDYLKKNPKTLYINLSSGAVFGKSFDQAITDKTKTMLNINSLESSEYYSIAKINSEAKHRSLSHLNIVDFRVFAFFSRFVDVKSEFIMSEIIDCLKNGKLFVTGSNDIIRDYITPYDLFRLIILAINKHDINDVFDVYSDNFVTKFQLLDFLKENYNFEYKVQEDSSEKVGFNKNVYYSLNKKAKELGYIPEFSSLTGIKCEIDKMYKYKMI